MSDDREREGFSLGRWSRLKREAAEPAVSENPASPAGSTPAPLTADSAPAPAATPPAATPPLDSLTIDSDFTAFMRPGVDAATRTAAVKTLFRDPQFNVMDGLDVYIDDYSKPDPIPPALLARLQEIMRKLEGISAQDPEQAASKAGDAPQAGAIEAPPRAAGIENQCDGEKTGAPAPESAAPDSAGPEPSKP
jgi:hypothetical protein